MNRVLTMPMVALVSGMTGCATLDHTPNLPSLPSFDRLSLGAEQDPNAHPMNQKMRVATAALRGGDIGAAVRIYREVARHNPGEVEPRLRLGEALLAANAPHEAERAYRGAVRMEQDNAEARLGLARSYLALRQPTEALKQFERVLVRYPGHALALNGKAVALDQLGQHKAAQDIYLTLLDEDPSNIKVRSNYGLSLALEGRSAQASDVLASLSAAPDAEARIRHNLALAYGLAGNDGQAAHVARLDLDEDAVNNNLQYYQRMRNVENPVTRSAPLSKPANELVSEHFKDHVPTETTTKVAGPAVSDTGSDYSAAGDDLEEHEILERVIAPLEAPAASPVALVTVEADLAPVSVAVAETKIISGPAAPAVPKRHEPIQLASSAVMPRTVGRDNNLPAVPRLAD